MRLPPKELIFQILKRLSFAVGIIIISGLFINVLKEKILLIKDSLKEQEKTAFILTKRSETIDELKKDFEKIGNADEQIKNSRPPIDNLVDFVGAVENAGRESGLQIALTFSPPLQETFIDYTLSLRGTAAGFADFLKKFEKLPYLTNVSNFDIKSSVGNWDNDAVISLSARLYTEPVSE